MVVLEVAPLVAMVVQILVVEEEVVLPIQVQQEVMVALVWLLLNINFKDKLWHILQK
jgi:hypothetical protein